MDPELITFHPNDLALYHRNPRLGNVRVIADSLRAHGQYRPIVVNRGTHTGRANEVLAGNHTLMAFRDLLEAEPEQARWTSVAGYVIDVDADQAARIVAVDNRSAELGDGYDDAALAELLGSLPDLDGTGFTDDDLADIRAQLDELPPIVPAEGEAAPTPRTGEDGLISSTDIVTQAESYTEASTRLMVLTLPLDQFIWANDRLAAYREEQGLESNTEALLRLLEAWSGLTAPEAPADGEE